MGYRAIAAIRAVGFLRVVRTATTRVEVDRTHFHSRRHPPASRATKGRELLGLVATRVQTPPLSPTSNPHPHPRRGEAEQPSGEPGMHHDPNPFDEGGAEDNPFSVRTQTLLLPYLFLVFLPKPLLPTHTE